MKRITLLLLCTLTLLTGKSYAQEKGEMYIGGDLSLGLTTSTYNETDNVETSFSIAPEFAYFVTDNLRIGGSINYEYYLVHEILINPSIAYYVKLADKFYYVPEFSIGGGLILYEDLKYLGLQLELGLFAVEFRPTDHFAMSVSLLNLGYANIGAAQGFTFTLGATSSVGLRYYF